MSKRALYDLFSAPPFTYLWYFLGGFTVGNDLTLSVKTLLVFPSVRRPWWTRWKTFIVGLFQHGLECHGPSVQFRINNRS